MPLLARPLRLVPLASFVVVGCAAQAPATQLVIGVRVAMEVPAEADTLDVEIVTPSGATRLAQTPLARRDELQTLGIRYVSGPLSAVRVRARALRGSEVRVEASRTTSFVLQQSRLLSLTLDASCVGVRCAEESTCQGGACVPSRIEGSDLPIFEGEFPEPMDAGGRDAGADARESPDAHIDAHVDNDARDFPDAVPASDAYAGDDARAVPDAFAFDAAQAPDATSRDAGTDTRDAFVDNCTCPNIADRCVNGLCIGGACSAVSPCADSMRYTCGMDSQCVCNQATCAAMCTRDAQCGSLRTCRGGTCIPRENECFASLQCAAGEQCTRPGGTGYLSCTTPALGMTPLGGTCSPFSWGQCASGFCFQLARFGDGVCLNPCQRTADCGSLVCTRESPGPSGRSSFGSGCLAASSSPCPMGCAAAEICTTAGCQRPGVRGSDCLAGSYCLGGICAVGTTCTASELAVDNFGMRRCTNQQSCAYGASCPMGYTCGTVSTDLGSVPTCVR